MLQNDFMASTKIYDQLLFFLSIFPPQLAAKLVQWKKEPSSSETHAKSYELDLIEYK